MQFSVRCNTQEVKVYYWEIQSTSPIVQKSIFKSTLSAYLASSEQWSHLKRIKIPTILQTIVKLFVTFSAAPAALVVNFSFAWSEIFEDEENCYKNLQNNIKLVRTKRGDQIFWWQKILFTETFFVTKKKVTKNCKQKLQLQIEDKKHFWQKMELNYI